MSTYIDGIGASENIDSSGERISIAGMDISSLTVDGVFNWEHNKDQPSQVVGKVLVAKKIFSEKDCDDERQAYFWQKCQTPFVYVMGELMDDYKESAKEVAGMFRYDSDRQGQQERNVMNFSIEGAKIDKQGIDIVKSIARKVTITVLPCNKAAIAEMVPAQGTKKPKDDLDSLFKSETTVEIELIKTQDMKTVLDTLHKSLKLVPPADARGTHIGKTKSGKDIHSHEKVHNYQGFTSHDHNEAANLHYNAIKQGDSKSHTHHMGKMKLHRQALQSAEKRENRGANALANARANHVAARPAAGTPAPKPASSAHRPYAEIPDLKKTTTLGSANVAPGQLSGGAALAKQCLDPKMHKGCTHGDLKKSEFWLQRAEQEYAKWDKKELFVEFMAKKYPEMTKTEIDVHGSVLALKKSLDNEAKLEELTKVLKFGDGKPYTGPDATPRSKVPEHHKGKSKEVKGITQTEVEHVEPHYTGEHDAVYLKSGHRSEHELTGKYKVGDKVTIKAHIQGTHILRHGHSED